jgi:cobyrinic acid a,c-diamide synthase
VRVAVAYDDAFGGYFPDTLDQLELRGAAIADFSPLADERLPPETDVVYLGCGHPERFAAQLSKNDCLMLALKSHLCSGRRIYAECGGLAYLCREIEMPGGDRWPMVGALPATAHFDPTPSRPTPTEVRLASDTWLGSAGQCWRGYLNPRWSLRPAHQLEACGDRGAGRELDVVKRHQAVGSRVYLNFASKNELLESFFVPRAGAGGPAAARGDA